MFDSFTPEDWERYRALVSSPEYLTRQIKTPIYQERVALLDNPPCRRCSSPTKKNGFKTYRLTGKKVQQYLCKDCHYSFGAEE